MDKIIEILKQLGINNESIFLKLMVLGVAIPVIFTIAKVFWKAVQFLILYKNQKLLNRNLSPFFSQSDVDKATRYYIPTKFQNVSPSEDDEPNKKYIASAKQKIIPLFLKVVFKKNSDDNKYYLILADSGMGKTTFMINLYLSYKNKLEFFGIKRNIVLFPLGSPDALTAVKNVEDKKNTILLLDVFDEDINADKNHQLRIKEILNCGKDYCVILITCRTQFFPSEEELPTEATYIKTYGDGQTEYKFQKLYLSVFDDKDVNNYLKKKFPLFPRFWSQLKKRINANKIISKSPNLVMRPMLLSYIDDLVNEQKIFWHSYEVYEVLIEKWLIRESKKPNIIENYKSSENYKKLLYNLGLTQLNGYLIKLKNESAESH